MMLEHNLEGLFGKKIIPNQNEWLLGPFGKTKGIGLKFIKQLSKKEHLEIDILVLNLVLLKFAYLKVQV